MHIRLYQADDNAVLARLFSDTVRAVNAADYSPEQVEVWAEDTPDLEPWRSRVTGRVIFVAEHGGEITGFASFEPDGHLDHLYVHHLFLRQGTASALLRRVEGEAISLGIGRIFTEASITARPFFEKFRFRVITSQTVALRGVSFLNYRMEKFLT